MLGDFRGIEPVYASTMSGKQNPAPEPDVYYKVYTKIGKNYEEV